MSFDTREERTTVLWIIIVLFGGILLLKSGYWVLLFHIPGWIWLVGLIALGAWGSASRESKR